MFTPQEIQEQTFSKAVFGGYDMQQVDDFLEPLTEDYIMLYKENSVLKSKMKVLVEKLEEYRGQEAAMKQQMAQAQAQCDRIRQLADRFHHALYILFAKYELMLHCARCQINHTRPIVQRRDLIKRHLL